ncbi:MAG TPA: DNA-3-methyladenine glycosylase I [Acidimicrobiales bacterium]|nr:DNA-3-methyladenine glycosylase I [Acidimicrobiales bacterium]
MTSTDDTSLPSEPSPELPSELPSEPSPELSSDPSSDPSSDLVVGDDGHARCSWGARDPLYVAYHDDEWGRPLRDERALFELLCLEAFQSGLAWITILRKRPGFRVAFDDFDVGTVAAYGDDDIARLMADAAIVRNRAKVDAAIANARATLRLHESGRTLVDLVFAHAPPPDERPARRPRSFSEVPSTTPSSKALAAELRGSGFRFVGPVVAYALMQSAGVVDDHLEGCWVAP